MKLLRIGIILGHLEPESSLDPAGSHESSSTSSSTAGKKKQKGAKSAPVAERIAAPDELDLDELEKVLLQAALAHPVVTQKAAMKKPAAASGKAKAKAKAAAKAKVKAKAKAKSLHKKKQKKKSEEECKTSKRKRLRDAAYHSAKNAALKGGLSPGRARLKAAEAAEARARRYDALRA